MLNTLSLIVHIGVAAGLIVLVLLQHGKGADAGAAFGSGASATVFGARGSASFLTRTTGILATIFFATSLLLAFLSGGRHEAKSITETTTLPAQIAPFAPADVPVAPEAAATKSDVPATDMAKPAQSSAPMESAPAAVSAPTAAPTQESGTSAGGTPSTP